MKQIDSVLKGISINKFLTEYWQKKPLLIRQALPGFSSPIDPDELAGLACEDDVESRLVEEQGAEGPWQLRHGPFTEEDFAALPEQNWTLLVQAVDHHVPELTPLLDAFNFIPNWRIDDLMISYAPKGGSVGPHFDYYDVFLLQAYGTRRWQLGDFCTQQTPTLPGTPLHILSHFDAKEDWLLEPGDLLYLPPQLAHYGVAQDDCMTYSIGFRAPSAQEILTQFADFASDALSEDDRYSDPDLTYQSNPGLIGDDAIAKLKRILLREVENEKTLKQWFGRYMTEPRYPDMPFQPEQALDAAQLQAAIEAGRPLLSSEGSRFAFTESGSDLGITLYVDGEAFPCDHASAELGRYLCQQRRHASARLRELCQDQAAWELLAQLYNQGSLYLDDNA